MIEQSACFGCCVNPNFFIPFPSSPGCYTSKPATLVAPEGLTTDEISVLQKLVDSWLSYIKLDKRSEADDREFLDAIHRTQQIIALRVARRVNPEVWA